MTLAAAGCGEDSGTTTGPEQGLSLAAAGTRVISILPSGDPVDFGTLIAPFGPDEASFASFMITNEGTKGTSALTVALTGPNAALYRIEPGSDTCTGRSLGTSSRTKSCFVMVAFAPTAVGTFTAKLSVTVAQPKTTVSVNLTGRAVEGIGIVNIRSQVTGTDVTTSYAMSGRSFSLTDGQGFSFVSVSPGTRQAAMTAIPDGYQLDSITCSETGLPGYQNTGVTTVDVPAGTVSVNLQSGETVDCTFAIREITE